MPTWTQGLLDQLIPWFSWIVNYTAYYDATATVSSGFRSAAKQAQLYQRYLSGLSRYPAAPPGSSYHEFGRAIDIVASDEALSRAGAAWQSVGGTWGGATDPIHFQA